MSPFPSPGSVPAPAWKKLSARASVLLLLLGGATRAWASPPLELEVCPDLEKTGSCPGLVELEVRDVIPVGEAETHAVVLISKDKQSLLPIFVDETAALAIALRLAHRANPEPLSQDLLNHMVHAFGVEVTGVRIDAVHQHVFATRIFLRQGKKAVGLSAPPSDAVAMALAGGARIFVTKSVLAEAGITRKEIDELREQHRGVGGSGPGSAATPGTKGPAEISL